MSGEEKPWQRPWSMDEIIANADTWSLAGDAALLNTLKAFGTKLITQTTETSNNVDNLLKNLNRVSVKLELAQNEFSSLRNTQFIESRVYEEDETQAAANDSHVEQKPMITDEERDARIKSAVLKGLAVVDKYYEQVKLDVSDSEDDVEESYVLKPKYLYNDRPLPYVIGTDEWYKDATVGLENSDSEDESDKHSEEVYSTDNESDVSITSDHLNIKASNSSSEIDFSNKNHTNKPVANSTLNESTQQPELYGSSDSDSYPAQPPLSNQKFVEQLTSKLGSVISREEVPEPEINRKPIQKPEPKDFGLFSDEPPPLEASQSGLFSGGTGLFDDEDDDLFWGQKQSKIVEEAKAPAANKTKDLFDSEDSEDDMFVTRKSEQKQSILQPLRSSTIPLLQEEPPQIENKKVEKLPGAVKLFPDVLQKPIEEKIPEVKEAKKVSLFDDADDLFQDDLFSSVGKSFTSNLFDDAAGGLFEKTEAEAAVKKTKSLFDDDDDDFSSLTTKSVPKVSLFDSSPPPDDDWDTKSDEEVHVEQYPYNSGYTGRGSSLFDNEPPSLAANESSGIVRDPSSLRSDVETDNSFYPYASSSRRLSSEIYNEQQSNDSFFVTKNKTEHTSVAPSLESIQETAKANTSSESYVDVTPSGDAKDFEDVFENTNKPKKVSLFDDTPSDDDDLFSVKKKVDTTDGAKSSKNVSSILEKLQNSSAEKAETKTNSPGKLKHNLNINVGALMPGVGPPKKKTEVKEEPVSETPPQEAVAEDSPINLEKPEENVNILHSMTKDRARIQIRRKPSTRRGREILRNSVVDFNEENPYTEKTNNTNKKEEELFDDIFTTDSNKPQPFDSSPDSDLFNTSANNSFTAKEVESAKPKKINIFDEESDDEDFFVVKKKPPKQEPTRKLFDDDDDEDDDLFGSSSTTTKPIGTKVLEQQPKPSVKKFENVETVKNDPLSDLFD